MNHDEKMIEIKPEDHPDIAGGWVWTNLELRWINKRIAEAVVAEREACAKVIDATDLSALRDDPMTQNWVAAMLFSYAAASPGKGAIVNPKGRGQPEALKLAEWLRN